MEPSVFPGAVPRRRRPPRYEAVHSRAHEKRCKRRNRSQSVKRVVGLDKHFSVFSAFSRKNRERWLRYRFYTSRARLRYLGDITARAPLRP